MSEVDNIIKDRADWLVDAVATATQNRTYLRGEPECDMVACDAIRMNGEKAISVAIARAILAERKRCADIARNAPARRYADNPGFVDVPASSEQIANLIETTT